jgi:hypothetical protein
MVYVVSKDGQPLMPTENGGKVRHLLKERKAKVIRNCPFTIQLLYETMNYTQEITLGVDAGSRTIGLSASTEKKEYYASEVELRNDIVDLLSVRRAFRKTRRNRKTRYRAPRFENRVATKKEGWLAPSIRQKIETHLTAVEQVRKILPISRIIVETASFDLQKLKADEAGLKRPESSEYQEGEMLGFWNAREYVLFRDDHECQCCHGKSKDKVLNVHHIESRKVGGNAPNNLVTLCETCHALYHKGKVKLNLKRGTALRDAVFMGIMRWAFYNQLKETYENVSMTYGYLTKHIRISNELPKEHCVDARCIAGHPKAVPAEERYVRKKERRHNRQIHKANPKKGIRKKNQAPYVVKGFRLFDKVSYKGVLCFIMGRRQSGYFDLRLLDGTSIHRSAPAKELQIQEMRSGYLIEKKERVKAE